MLWTWLAALYLEFIKDFIKQKTKVRKVFNKLQATPYQIYGTLEGLLRRIRGRGPGEVWEKVWEEAWRRVTSNGWVSPTSFQAPLGHLKLNIDRKEDDVIQGSSQWHDTKKSESDNPCKLLLSLYFDNSVS